MGMVAIFGAIFYFNQGFIKQSEQFEDRNVASDDTSNYKIVEKNDFAYNPAYHNWNVAKLLIRKAKPYTSFQSLLYVIEEISGFKEKFKIFWQYLEMKILQFVQQQKTYLLHQMFI